MAVNSKLMAINKKVWINHVHEIVEDTLMAIKYCFRVIKAKIMSWDIVLLPKIHMNTQFANKSSCASKIKINGH